MLSNLIPEQDQARIRKFVQVFLHHQGSNPALGVPPDMVAGPSLDGEWTPWHPVDSPVDDRAIFEIETRLGVPFPPLFRAYLMYKCLLMTDFYPVILPQTPSDKPLEELLQLTHLFVTDDFFRSRRYLPFGQDSNGAGPVCFDTTKPDLLHDYPIIVVDHHLLRTKGYQGEQRWDSFSSLLADLENDMLSFDKNRSEKGGHS